MKRAMGLILLGVLAGGGWLLLQRRATAALAERLTAQATTLGAFELEHATSSTPVHDNGLRCLKLMLDVTQPTQGAAFSSGTLLAVARGEQPVAALGDEERAQVEAMSPWVAAVRECASSARLQFVEGLRPDEPRSRTKERLALVAPRLFAFSAVELRLVLEEKKPALAVERCTQTLALAADLSVLGVEGVQVMHDGVRVLAPPCAEALRQTSPDERAQAAKLWAQLPARVVSAKTLVDLERLSTGRRVFGAVLGLEPPAEKVMPGEQFLRGRDAVAFDEAMRALGDVVEQAEGRKTAAARAAAVVPGFAPERWLSQRDEASELLTLLLAMALNDTSARPHVTRDGDVVTFTPSEGAPIRL